MPSSSVSVHRLKHKIMQAITAPQSSRSVDSRFFIRQHLHFTYPQFQKYAPALTLYPQVSLHATSSILRLAGLSDVRVPWQNTLGKALP